MSVLSTNDKSFDRCLRMAIAAVCKTSGFDVSNESALETLLALTKNLIAEFGRQSKAMSELVGRPSVSIHDAVAGLTALGLDVVDLADDFRENQASGQPRFIIPPPKVQQPPASRPPGAGTGRHGATHVVDPKPLRIGKPAERPGHIPVSLPEFPDPHTYIETPILTEAAPDYRTIRERSAALKRNTSLALVNFMCKTLPSKSIITGDERFSVLLPQPRRLPYLEALLANIEPEENEPKPEAKKDSATTNAAEDGTDNKAESTPTAVKTKNKKKKADPKTDKS